MADPTTQSNWTEIYTRHISFIWDLSFKEGLISGSATHDLEIKVDNVAHVIFDTSDLDIHTVEVQGQRAEYTLKEKHPVMGSALHVSLPQGLKAGHKISVKIAYKTSTDCVALQWLAKEQTQGKTFPFLFSQCQPIYARTIAPVQDTPSLKITYSAEVSSVLPVLLSARRISPPSDGPPHGGKVLGKDVVTYVYDQPVGIPSYLIAIASGNLVYRPFPKVGTTSLGVWSEPELIDAAEWEFSEDTGRFMIAEEKILIPYEFGVYDLLVLPPSFPYGGMENACCSFLTPTLLTGDRALVDVVVHELTHSWFGNGITHANASHFWLNEGWTTYMERVLQEKLHTPAHRGFSYLIGAKALGDALLDYQDRPKYQRLVIDFEFGEDPDDAYSSIPYEKGSNFLLYLEQKVGGLETFLAYAKDYAQKFIGHSITTDQWKEHLFSYFEKTGGEEKIKALNSVNWDAWLHGTGIELPVDMMAFYDKSLAKVPYDLADRWNLSRSTDASKLSFDASDLKGFDTNQIILFLERLESFPPLPTSHLAVLGNIYGFDDTRNVEVKLRYFQVVLADPNSNEAQKFAAEAAHWVVGDDGSHQIKGRMKFCRPTFKLIQRVDSLLAVTTFNKYKTQFHPIARKLIEKDLDIPPSN